ncbi:MAG: hypothetical protein ABJO86_19100 [Lentilitoribacter sp.]
MNYLRAMRNLFQHQKLDALIFLFIITLWLFAFKSSSLFGFLKTYSSLWYLPAGVTLSIALAAPLRFLTAPLIANWLLAIPIVSSALAIEYTSVADHLLHGARLFVVYAGAGLILRYIIKVSLPVSNLSDQQKIIGVTLIASIVGAASGVSLHVAMGSFDWNVARDIILPWFIGDGIAAIIVPAILVPILKRYFDGSEELGNGQYFPTMNWSLFHLKTILIAMFVAFGLSSQLPSLGSLWYVIVLPPIVFAVRGGIPSAATTIVMTALLTPPIATIFEFEGERIALQFLLLIGASVSLMIGGAIADKSAALAIIKRHEEHLEMQVLERTQKLENAYQFQQHLIRSIGHDLQQPLFAVNHLVGAMDIKNKDNDLSKVIDQAEKVIKVSMDVAQKILDYAKREVGQVEPIGRRFAIQKVFDQIANSFEYEQELQGITISVTPTDLELVSDEHLVWEVLTNLVQNSVRLSKHGQVIGLSAVKQDNDVVIIVSDEVQDHRSDPGQAGFGLGIVRQISKMLNFEYSFELNCSKVRFLK